MATGDTVTIQVDGDSVEGRVGDSLLTTLLRSDRHPTGGGCLCCAGDCGHCLASVDGVSYVRTCQVPTSDGLEVERCHRGGAQPPLLGKELPSASVRGGSTEDAASSTTLAEGLLHRHCDVAVVGRGRSGRAEAERLRATGLDVATLDAKRGEEVAGIYPARLLLVRTPDGMQAVHAREEIVVATGAAEIQPVGLGTELFGLLTASACAELHRAGLDLGRVAALGEAPEGVDAVAVEGRFVRCEGDGRVNAVVTMHAAGRELRTPCDTVSFGLGLHPRDALLRMGRGLGVRAVGRAAQASDIPPPPVEGVVCACAGVAVSDLKSVWDNGFQELELVKRATLAGTGTCQGAACLPHIRSFLEQQGKTLQPPFTARPLTRQLTFEQAAAGAHPHATPRTPLHDEHLEHGAHMQRSGGWWRPWDYGDVEAERAAVRERVSLGDVSTLGKFLVQGKDALPFLELIYPTQVKTLRDGRSRYALLLNERGYVLDDGLICRDSDERFFLTLTSAGSTFGELWLRDWAESRDFDVVIVNQTQTLAAINVTGPKAAELLVRASADKLPGFARHAEVEVAGVACRVLRLSFTGELSYELHHAAADSVALWRALMRTGADLGVRPHGLDALLRLRLEKGHIVVGQDTDFDSTPRRIQHQWAVSKAKTEFIGRQAVLRTDQQPLDRQLVGLTMPSPAPLEGTPVWNAGDYAGYVTSSTDSVSAGAGDDLAATEGASASRAVLLAWVGLVDGALPETVRVGSRENNREATLTALPFFDAQNERSKCRVDVELLRAGLRSEDVGAAATANHDAADRWGRFERFEACRLAAAATVLDGVVEALGNQVSEPVLRTAPDEALVLSDLAEVQERVEGADGSNVVVERETGYAGVWLEPGQVAPVFARAFDWQLPAERPVLAQGAAFDIPVKLWLDAERTLLLVPAPLAAALERRMSRCERALVEAAQ